MSGGPTGSGRPGQRPASGGPPESDRAPNTPASGSGPPHAGPASESADRRGDEPAPSAARGPRNPISSAHAGRLVDEEVARVFRDPPTERVPLEHAAGRILAESVVADRHGPPFDRAAMDGIAVVSAVAEDGIRRFLRVGVLPAGDDPRPFANPESRDRCVEIATGAAVPEGFDAVVRYEDLVRDESSGQVHFELSDPAAASNAIAPATNIHRSGEDYRRGERLLSPGVRIASTHVAVLATCGVTSVEVIRSPSVAVLATGSELVGIDTQPLEHQIRESNRWTLRAELAGWGFPPRVHDSVADDPAAIADRIAVLLEANDVLVLSGAVSRGVYDSIPAILERLGVEIRFHGVYQRPGKPFLFGTTGRSVVFALPGNPVSSLVTLRRYLIPALVRFGFGRCASAGCDSVDLAAAGLDAVLDEEISFAHPLTYFPAVRRVSPATEAGEPLRVRPIAGHGSGDFLQLAGSIGVVEMPPDIDSLPEGSRVRLFPWAAR